VRGTIAERTRQRRRRRRSDRGQRGEHGGHDGATDAAGGVLTGGGGGSLGTGGSGATTRDDEAILLRADVVTGSCMPDVGINRYLTRMRAPGWHPGTYYDPPPDSLECLATATSGCDAVASCLGCVRTIGAGAGGDDEQRTGSVFQYRNDAALRRSRRTARVSVSSVSRRWGAARRSRPRCVTRRPSCPPARRRGVDGSAMTGSSSGRAAPSSVPPAPRAQCVGSGTTCPETSLGTSFNALPSDEGIECLGDVLRSCVGGRLYEQPCTALGPDFRCQVIEDNPMCVGLGCSPVHSCGLADECVPGEVPPAMSGTGESGEGMSVRRPGVETPGARG